MANHNLEAKRSNNNQSVKSLHEQLEQIKADWNLLQQQYRDYLYFIKKNQDSYNDRLATELTETEAVDISIGGSGKVQNLWFQLHEQLSNELLRIDNSLKKYFPKLLTAEDKTLFDQANQAIQKLKKENKTLEKQRKQLQDWINANFEKRESQKAPDDDFRRVEKSSIDLSLKMLENLVASGVVAAQKFKNEFDKNAQPIEEFKNKFEVLSERIDQAVNDQQLEDLENEFINLQKDFQTQFAHVIKLYQDDLDCARQFIFMGRRNGKLTQYKQLQKSPSDSIKNYKTWMENRVHSKSVSVLVDIQEFFSGDFNLTDKLNKKRYKPEIQFEIINKEFKKIETAVNEALELKDDDLVQLDKKRRELKDQLANLQVLKNKYQERIEDFKKIKKELSFDSLENAITNSLLELTKKQVAISKEILDDIEKENSDLQLRIRNTQLDAIRLGNYVAVTQDETIKKSDTWQVQIRDAQQQFSELESLQQRLKSLPNLDQLPLPENKEISLSDHYKGLTGYIEHTKNQVSHMVKGNFVQVADLASGTTTEKKEEKALKAVSMPWYRFIFPSSKRKFVQEHVDAVEELAEQIVNMNRDLFLAIPVHEFQDPNPKRSPRLRAFSNAFNQLSFHVTNMILQHAKIDTRTLEMERWIAVMEKCYQMGDYSGARAIYAGLNVAEIHRLSATKAGLSSNAEQLLNEKFKFLLSPNEIQNDIKERKNVSIIPSVSQIGQLAQFQEKLDLVTQDIATNEQFLDDVSIKLKLGDESKFDQGWLRNEEKTLIDKKTALVKNQDKIKQAIKTASDEFAQLQETHRDLASQRYNPLLEKFSSQEANVSKEALREKYQELMRKSLKYEPKAKALQPASSSLLNWIRTTFWELISGVSAPKVFFTEITNPVLKELIINKKLKVSAKTTVSQLQQICETTDKAILKKLLKDIGLKFSEEEITLIHEKNIREEKVPVFQEEKHRPSLSAAELSTIETHLNNLERSLMQNVQQRAITKEMLLTDRNVVFNLKSKLGNGKAESDLRTKAEKIIIKIDSLVGKFPSGLGLFGGRTPTQEIQKKTGHKMSKHPSNPDE